MRGEGSARLDPFLQSDLLRFALEPGDEFGRHCIGVLGLVESHHQVGDAIALQQPLRRGQRDAQVTIVEILEAGAHDANNLHVNAVQRAVRGYG